MRSVRYFGQLSLCALIATGFQACSSGGGGENQANPVSGAAASEAATEGTKTDTSKQQAAPQGPSAGNPPPQANPNPPPITPITPAPPAASAPNPLRTRQVRILCLGDSMTVGSENNAGSFRSYRGRLQQLLANAGINADFIGTSHLTPAIGGDPDHEGYGGAYIGPGGSSNNVWDRLPVALGSSVDPDIVIMAFGWNSVYNEPALAASKYQAIVNQVALLKPNAHLVVATLTPQRYESEAQSNLSVPGYRELNETARQMANLSVNDKVFLADFAVVDFPADDYWDIIHWLQPNADKAAQILFSSLIAGPLKP